MEYYYQLRIGKESRAVFPPFSKITLARGDYSLTRDRIQVGVRPPAGSNPKKRRQKGFSRGKQRFSDRNQSDTVDAISVEQSRKGPCFLNGLLKCMVIGKILGFE